MAEQTCFALTRTTSKHCTPVSLHMSYLTTARERIVDCFFCLSCSRASARCLIIRLSFIDWMPAANFSFFCLHCFLLAVLAVRMLLHLLATNNIPRMTLVLSSTSATNCTSTNQVLQCTKVLKSNTQGDASRDQS